MNWLAGVLAGGATFCLILLGRRSLPRPASVIVVAALTPCVILGSIAIVNAARGIWGSW